MIDRMNAQDYSCENLRVGFMRVYSKLKFMKQVFTTCYHWPP